MTAPTDDDRPVHRTTAVLLTVFLLGVEALHFPPLLVPFIAAAVGLWLGREVNFSL